MLERLVELLRPGDTRNVNELARIMDTSPEMVRAMLEHLSRLGYLKAIDNTCNAACGDCPLASSCKASAGEKIWMINPSA